MINQENVFAERTMKSLVLVLTLVASGLAAQPSTKATTPAIPAKADAPSSTILDIALTIPAPLPKVWKAFATSKGFMTSLPPDATVDLRPGDNWLCHFPGGSPGGGPILELHPAGATRHLCARTGQVPQRPCPSHHGKVQLQGRRQRHKRASHADRVAARRGVE